LTGDNVEEVFLMCARSILTRIENGTLDPTKVGSGVQMGENRSGAGIVVDTDDSEPAQGGGCKC